MEAAVAVGDKPCAHCNRHAAQDQKLVADDKGGQNHESDAAEGDGGAGGDTADDGSERWPGEGGKAENEESDANPDDALEAGEFGSKLASGVFLGGTELRSSVGFLALDDRQWGGQSEAG